MHGKWNDLLRDGREQPDPQPRNNKPHEARRNGRRDQCGDKGNRRHQNEPATFQPVAERH